ncbi:MAG: HD domain-containing protein [Candidatus Omnitrophica bacterium]|jgi:HD-GYP domain-containing protein (c-di-GMP phosphodiesterase class II)|nr:HD domain-containing protein [Candidatus Omnitrophota bacterium]
MKPEYHKKLQTAARQTILIHRADTLIRIILRTIVTSLKVKHAGIFIYDKVKDEYVVKMSRGHSGLKVPAGFIKIRKDNPLIRYFTDKSINLPKEHILWSKIISRIKYYKTKKDLKTKRFLEALKFDLSLYEAKACIPGFFRKDLVGVLFLGEKNNKRIFSEEELRFLSVLASDVVMALKNAWLIEDLNRQIGINKRLLFQTVSALASSIEAKDQYTIGHTERVANYCLAIACVLKKRERIEGWEKFLENLKIAALFHDIGKIGISESILHKETALDEEERRVIQTHPLIGANILNHIEEFRQALEGVKYHHEKYDGTGYPCHLKGRKIPLIALIISLADTFDAMITDRPYRKGLPQEKAIEEIKKVRGVQFAPNVVDAFLKIYNSKGKLWELNKQVGHHLLFTKENTF